MQFIKDYLLDFAIRNFITQHFFLILEIRHIDHVLNNIICCFLMAQLIYVCNIWKFKSLLSLCCEQTQKATM